MRPLLLVLLAALFGAACWPPRLPWRHNSPPASRDSARLVARDTLEQHAARLELRVLEQEAQVAELQSRLDDARRAVVRAMAKLQSLATRAEAASGIAEAEIALQALRAGGGTSPSPEYAEASQLLQLATTEFDQQNYGGAVYLATQAKNAAAPGQGRPGGDDRQTARKGEVAFALPLRLQTTGRANVREGPGSGFNVLFTLEPGAPIVAYSYVDQWVRVKDESDRPGWIHQTLIGRRP